jgi:hypothetical protein
MKKKKKYLIKESELKEIIKEMILMEVYNPNDYKNLYSTHYRGKTANLKDIGTQGLNMVKNIGNFPLDDIASNLWTGIKNGYEGNQELYNAIKNAFGDSLSPEAREHLANGDYGEIGRQFWGRIAPPEGAAAPENRPLGKPTNADAHEQLSVSRAVSFIWQNSTNSYSKFLNGRCAARVREALNYGGLSLPSGMRRPGQVSLLAKDYLTILPANGWDEINPEEAGHAGDVVVMNACYATLPNGGRNAHPSGHIAMCCGGGRWVSDFKQNSVLGINGTVPENCVHYYRYRNIVQ